ncbi:hypothetical protein F4778DRAFT_748571 [Xylariomycetidae sp. FL2044]|nr:hypothetical protein F4778DRAFT_748571 [Xylariomycetidae sp. FL2044]
MLHPTRKELVSHMSHSTNRNHYQETPYAIQSQTDSNVSDSFDDNPQDDTHNSTHGQDDINLANSSNHFHHQEMPYATQKHMNASMPDSIDNLHHQNMLHPTQGQPDVNVPDLLYNSDQQDMHQPVQGHTAMNMPVSLQYFHSPAVHGVTAPSVAGENSTRYQGYGHMGLMQSSQEFLQPAAPVNQPNTAYGFLAVSHNVYQPTTNALPAMMTPSAASPVRPQRKRATRACDPCHAQHEPCEGNGIPCQTCARKNRVRTDTRAKGRRGPMPNHQGLGEAVLGFILKGDKELEKTLIAKLQGRVREGSDQTGLEHIMDGSNRATLRSSFASTELAAMLKGTERSNDE